MKPGETEHAHLLLLMVQEFVHPQQDVEASEKRPQGGLGMGLEPAGNQQAQGFGNGHEPWASAS